MNADFQSFLLSLLHTSMAAGVLVLVVLVTQRVFRRQLSPHWHAALWLLVVVRLLPISVPSDVSLFNFLPAWSSGPGAASAPQPLDPHVLPLPLHITGDHGVESAPVAPLSSSDRPGSASPENDAPVFTWDRWSGLFALWLAGVLTLGGYVIAVSVSLHRSLRSLKPLQDPAALALLDTCCRQMNIRRRPRLIESELIRTPALHGVWQPRLLLPAGFTERFSREEQSFVFLHELAHLRRRDLLLNWLMTGLQIIHWFNPLVWYGFARWRIDREIACDAAALEAAGAGSGRAYGETMLRLLQNFSAAAQRPGLVGILENRHQLQQRLARIARFTPDRRKFAALGLFSILALVGLSDAQVSAPLPAAPPTASAIASNSSPAVPAPARVEVVFLVSLAESMLGDSAAEVAHWRTQPDAQKITAPKWVRASQTLESLLRGLAPGTSYQVTLCGEASLFTYEPAIRDDDPNDPPLALLVRRMREAIPAGQFNLELALESVAGLQQKPDRVVLITDSLPAGPDDAARVLRFNEAVRTLPPRVAVHTVLLPKLNDHSGTAGLYWGLANATRGELTTVPSAVTAPRTHLAFVIDTSGSMRDPNNGFLWPIVTKKIEEVLDAHPNLTGLQLLDGDGRFILPRRGTGSAGWNPNTPETRERIKASLRSYNQDTVSNPVPGVYNAVRFLNDKDAPDMRMGIYLFGDEFNSSDPAATAIGRLDALNPRTESGQRRIVINAIGFPTTIRAQFSMGNTGLRFADLMRAVTHEHDGSFVALPEL